MKRFVLPALSFMVAIALAGCGSDKPADVKQQADSSSPVVVDSPTATPPSSEASSEGPTTAKLGDTVSVADWDVKVVKIFINADVQIHAANMFNDKPKGQYVLVTYQATYTGSERTADTSSDLEWSFSTTDNQVHNPASEVTPADNQEWPTEARTGGTVHGQQVFDLQPTMVKGGILTVQGYDKNFDTVYADFRV